MNNSNKKTIIITAIISSILSISLFVILVFMMDDSSSVDSATEAIATGQQETPANASDKTVEIIDKENMLTIETESYIRQTVIPVANKYFDIESIIIYYHEDIDLYNFNIKITTESFGELMTQNISKFGLDEDLESFNKGLEDTVTRINKLLEVKFDDVEIELAPIDSNRVVIRTAYGKADFNFFRFVAEAVYNQ